MFNNTRVVAITLTCVVYFVTTLFVNYSGGSTRSLLKVSNGESVALTKPNNVPNDRMSTHNENIAGSSETARNIDAEMIAVKNVDDSFRATNNSTRDVQHNYGATVQESNGILSSTHTNTSPGIIQADSAGDQEDTTAFIYNNKMAPESPTGDQQTSIEESETPEVSLLGGSEDNTNIVQESSGPDNDAAAASSPGDEEAGAAPGDEAGAAPVLPDNHLVLDITINMTGVTLTVDGRQVYGALNNTAIWGWGPVRLHAGLHLVTLHQVTGRVMTAHSYMTWQPSLDKAFLKALGDIQNGRLLVILGAPDFTSFLEEATILVLEEMGALYIDRLAYKDTWCLLVHKGGRVVLEALTTSLPHHNLTEFDVSPLTLHVSVPRTAERVCGWYGVAGMQERAAFCDTYDGYGDFCSCHDPPWSPFPHKPMEYEMEEVIPVAIVTARRLPHVLRQVGQVWASPGGTNTPITIFVDGHNPEAQALAALLHLPVVQHHNPASKGSTSRINAHVKFVLTKVFEQYLKVDKAIILEDDLDLAPDFIPFFQQTAVLLSRDSSLLCVNAYNQNAFSHTAHSPSRLYRVHGVPACGWMVRRQVAWQLTSNWIPRHLGIDWDQWVRQTIMGERDILVPEIPRTKHRGGGGVHVTGIEQELYYNQRPLNALINVTLDVHGAERENYLKLHLDSIRQGHVVRFTTHPCEDMPIPKHQVNQSYVVHINQPDETINSSRAYYVVARCLGLDDHIFHENLQMMYTASFYGNQLYVVGCPNSPFCLTEDPEVIYSPTPEAVTLASNRPFRRPLTSQRRIALRVTPISFQDEVSLTNIFIYD